MGSGVMMVVVNPGGPRHSLGLYIKKPRTPSLVDRNLALVISSIQHTKQSIFMRIKKYL